MSSQFEEKESPAGEVSYQMKPRYRQRIRIKIPVMFTSGSLSRKRTDIGLDDSRLSD